MIFIAFVRIHHKRNGSRAVLLYLVTANFIACTAYLAVDITAYQTNSLGWLLGSNALYTFIDFISQVILVNSFTYGDLLPTTDASGCPFYKDIQMLDDVAETKGYDCPNPVNTYILR